MANDCVGKVEKEKQEEKKRKRKKVKQLDSFFSL